MPQGSPQEKNLPETHSIVSLSLGGHALLQRLDTTLHCEPCGRDTQHQILYLGQRIAEVRCGECGRCIGMDREAVVRAFIGEVVMHVLRLPQEVTRELKRDPGRAVVALPRQMAKLPLELAHDAVQLLRMVRPLEADRGVLESLLSQVETVLRCERCQRETAHRILYLGRRMAEARCEECGRALGITREEVFSDFVGEVLLHLLKLPRHVRRELRSDFARAVRTLPTEMLRIPFRLARDFLRVVRILRWAGREERPSRLGGRRSLP